MLSNNERKKTAATEESSTALQQLSCHREEAAPSSGFVRVLSCGPIIGNFFQFFNDEDRVNFSSLTRHTARLPSLHHPDENSKEQALWRNKLKDLFMLGLQNID